MGLVYLFVLQLVVLFFLSKVVTREIYLFFYKWTRSRWKTTYLFSILFLVGTFVHEMSHFIMALILFVPVGQLELIPEYREDRLKLGSIPVGKTDPIRRFFIGVAPFIFGVSLILGLLYMIFIYNRELNFLWYLLTGFVIFSVGNTMFSSKKDLEGMLEFFGLVVFGLIVLAVGGVNLQIYSFIESSGRRFSDFFVQANIFLTLPILVDLLVIYLLRRRNKS